MLLPRVQFAGREIARLLVGGNPFSANSHLSKEVSDAMGDYYTTERIKATLRECASNGMTHFLGRADAHITRVLREYWNEGGQLKWIAQTAPEMASPEGNIKWTAAKAEMAYVHGGVADDAVRKGDVELIRRQVGWIRETGRPAGMAGHDPNTFRAVLDAGIELDFLMVCFYSLGRKSVEYTLAEGETYSPEDRDLATALIREVDLPCIAYKIMAAGRNDPKEAICYAFTSIKPTDVVCMGFFPKDRPNEIREDVGLALSAMGS